jgi:hypothetical protein
MEYTPLSFQQSFVKFFTEVLYSGSDGAELASGLSAHSFSSILSEEIQKIFSQ